MREALLTNQRFGRSTPDDNRANPLAHCANVFRSRTPFRVRAE